MKPRITYSIHPTDPKGHRFEVDLLIQEPDLKGQSVQLPRWIPGSYMIRDFSKHVESIKAHSFISKKVGLTNKKSVYYLMEDKGMDAFPIMIEMAIFTSKHFLDYLGSTYTKEARGVMIKNKKEYIAGMVKQYKRFKKGIVI